MINEICVQAITDNNIRFWETKNLKAVLNVARETSLQPWLFENNNPGKLNYDKLLDKNLIIIQVREGLKFCGLVFFTKENENARIDVAYLPNFRGKKALNLVEPILDYIQIMHKVKNFYGKIQNSNKKSLLFARWANFNVTEKSEKYSEVWRYG